MGGGGEADKIFEGPEGEAGPVGLCGAGAQGMASKAATDDGQRDAYCVPWAALRFYWMLLQRLGRYSLQKRLREIILQMDVDIDIDIDH